MVISQPSEVTSLLPPKEGKISMLIDVELKKISNKTKLNHYAHDHHYKFHSRIIVLPKTSLPLKKISNHLFKPEAIVQHLLTSVMAYTIDKIMTFVDGILYKLM